MGRLSELQIQRNSDSRGAWNHFAGHRAEMTRLMLKSVAQPGGKLCVLGAGNCNDLDLPALVTRFGEVHLVDLDGGALHSAVARQAPDRSHIRLHGGIDVTGIAELLSVWSPQSPAPDVAVDRCLQTASQTRLDLPAESFSVVVSACLLSQLIEALVLSLGAGHPRFLEALTCIRRRHLELICELTAPGGTALLISDIVSSATCPTMVHAEPRQLSWVVGQAIQARNFFTGVNPFVLKSILQSEPTLATRLQNVQLTNPWLWDLGPRVYAVCAITARKADRP